MSIRSSVRSELASAASSTGLSWGTVAMGTLIFGFVLYIAANGSLVKYKQLLF